MNYNILITLLLVTSLLQADWLEDLSKQTPKGQNINVAKAIEVADKYVNEDKAEIEKLAKKQSPKTDSVVAKAGHGLKDASLLASAKSSLKYHEAVYRFLKSLEKDKANWVEFSAALHDYRKLSEKFYVLSGDYSTSTSATDKVSLATQIAWVQTKLKAQEAVLNGYLIF